MLEFLPFLLLVVAHQTIFVVRADMFSSMSDVKTMLKGEQTIENIIKKFVAAERKRLDNVLSLAKSYKKNRKWVDSLEADYFQNPVNVYLAIKRLAGQWEQLLEALLNSTVEERLEEIESLRNSSTVVSPTDQDFEGAAAALMRLQDVYQLKTADIAAGKLGKYRNAKKFTADDCFRIGQFAYQSGDNFHCLEWTQEALRLVGAEEPPTADRAEILEHLSYCMFQQGNTERALALARQLLALKPDHKVTKRNIKFYVDALLSTNRSEPEPHKLPPVVNVRPELADQVQKTYEELCRGDRQLDERSRSKLYCYLKINKAYLRLAPIKVEVLHQKPQVLMIHNALSSREIAEVKKLARPLLQRTTVRNRDTGKLETSKHRISKSAWLSQENPAVARLTTRIGDMTDLNVTASEAMQVVNYGLGGHYFPHYDMATKGEEDPYGYHTGNRLASILFFLTVPEAGGASIFPDLQLSLSPKAGDALFWFNVMRSGDVDMSVLNGACPVLYGSKWVANKWIHERGQEFRRRCALQKLADD